MAVDFSDLDTNPNLAPSMADIRRSAHIVNGGESMVSCPRCGGTGMWRGIRLCFSCEGRGQTTKRKAGAQKAKVTKARNWAQWCEDHADLIEGLRRHEWNQFLRGLYEQIFGATRTLSERQVECAREAIARYDAKREEKRAAEAASRSTDIGVEAIHALFDTASKSGLKRPMFRAERVTVKQSKHPGVLYVYDRDAGGERGGYAGKIVDGKFVRARDADPSVAEAVRAVAANPAEAARAYGLSTGTCGLCGRELTDPISVKHGVGPVCANKWGF